MTTKFSINKSILGAAMALGISGAAIAEVSGSAAVSSMYLWRGQDLGDPTISGSLDYTDESGGYIGLWASSESGRSEYDIYAGYAGEAGGISYDIGFVDYNYPNDAEFDFQEAIVSLGMEVSGAEVGISFATGVSDYGHGTDYDALGKVDASNDDDYATLSYSRGDFTVLYGAYMYDADDIDYNHIDVTYAYNDNLSFTASKVVDADDCALGANADSYDASPVPGAADICDALFLSTGNTDDSADDANIPDDIMFNVTYSIPL